MTRSRTILAATDLSAPAHHAVERASHLAASSDGELCILHVTELDALDSLREVLGDDVSEVKGLLRKQAQTYLDELSREAAKHHGVAAKTCVTEGYPLAAIADEAHATEAQLVVLGARGESFLRHALLGSTVSRLLRKSTAQPLLVVKQAPHEAYRRVVVTVDFSPVSLQAIRLAKHWAPNAELVLLHAFELPYEGKLRYAGVDEQLIQQYVSSDGEARRKRLQGLAAAAGLNVHEYLARIVHGDPAQQIIAMEQEVGADLIVVGKHGSHIAEELLLGSVTKHVLAESQSDILVICDPREPPDHTM